MNPRIHILFPAAGMAGVAFAALALAAGSANAATVLYSTTFGGSSANNLSGQSVVTSGATAAEHTLYGTSASATWTANTKYKADGSYDSYTSTPPVFESHSATLAFTPTNGFVYTLTMTTDFSVASGTTSWYAVGFYKTVDYTGSTNNTTGSSVWMLTRPGSDNVSGDQVAHYNVNGGAGAQTALGDDDNTAPSTISIVLDTTGGAGNWAANYFVEDTLYATVADLNAVTIGSVGIGSHLNQTTTGRFTNLELSVVPEPSSAGLLGGMGTLLLLRRRRCA